MPSGTLNSYKRTREEVLREHPPMKGGIVVGVDGSESSKEALRWAAKLTSVVGGEIEAVIVWEFPPSYGWGVAIPEGWRPDLDAGKVLDAAIDDVFGSERPANLKTAVLEGRANYALLEAAAEADLLIVGSRGHGGFTGLLLGSVSAACAEHSHCPVLVVHAEKDEQGAGVQDAEATAAD